MYICIYIYIYEHFEYDDVDDHVVDVLRRVTGPSWKSYIGTNLMGT